MEAVHIDEFSPTLLADEDYRSRIRDLLETERLLIFHTDGKWSPAQFLNFGSVFGALQPSLAVDEHLDTHPSIQVMNRIGDPEVYRIPSSFYWHTDRSFLRAPPAVTILRAVQVPRGNGDTLFADVKGAYEQLIQAGQTSLEDSKAFHSYSYYHRRLQSGAYSALEKAAIVERFAGSWHPVMLSSPNGSWRAPYVSQLTIEQVVGSNGSDQGHEVEKLIESATVPTHVYRHQWTAGDVVVWSNVGLMHKGTPSRGSRILHRMVAGAVPATAPSTLYR